MTTSSPIEEYCRELKARLPAGTLRSGRVVRETRAHLEELAVQFRSKGLSAEEAQRAAVAQFGRVDDVAATFAEQAPLEPENEPMLRRALTFLVGITSLFAVAVILFTFTGHDEALWWSAIKVTAGICVMLEAWLTISFLRHERLQRDLPRTFIFLTSLALIALGSACGVWSAHLGMVTGDWDAYIAAGALLLMLQGAVTAWLARPNLTSSPTPVA